MNLKELAARKPRFVSGHRACSGCGFPQIVRTILASTDKRVVVANATGCLEVISSIYDYSSWEIAYIHSAFENAASTIAGIEAAYKVLRKKGLIKEDIKFLAIAGDGGLTDIGIMALSGALERWHDCVYVQYDNEAYMNTNVQRSGATPFGADTTTTPAGKIHHGKELFRKDIMAIVSGHKIPYIAQASLNNLEDLSEKAKKSFDVKGPAFLNVLQPCTLGWKFPQDMAIRIGELAVKTNFWPLYEIEYGKCKINYRNDKRLPIEEYLKLQGRFKHLNKEEINKIQENIDKGYNFLIEMDGKNIF